jgi:hypothetical protein
MRRSKRRGRESLSICCLARDPPLRVAELLRLVRNVADEIVVAADARVGASELAAYEGVADRLRRVEFEPPIERYLAWLHELCRGDWILRLDADEVPSRSLVDALPDLVSATDVHQYCTPRRWLFPTAATWLDEVPWTPDYQIRLVRNDPATLRFRGLIHTSAEPVLPRSYLEEPLYHLALVLAPISEREARVEGYDQLRTDKSPAVDNAGFYLPERREHLVTKPVPGFDRDLIEAVVGATNERRPAKEAAELSIVSRAEAERSAAGGPLHPAAYNARITPLVERMELELHETRIVPVRVENLGEERFPWGDAEPAVRLTYKWLRPDGEVVVADGPRTFLTADIAPGASGIVPLAVQAPPEPGPHRLAVDLVHEGVRWFGCPGEVVVDVRGGAASAGRAEFFEHHGDA